MSAPDAADEKAVKPRAAIWRLFGSIEKSTGVSDAVVGPSGDIYVCGSTSDPALELKDPIQKSFAGGRSDAFVAKLTGDGPKVLWCTYLGGSEADGARELCVDKAGHVYITGDTGSADFPVKKAPYPKAGGGNDAFVAKLSSDGRKLVFSTFLGGGGNDAGHGLALGPEGGVYVTGHAGTGGFPTQGGFQQKPGGPTNSALNAFVAKLAPDGSKLLYSTYLGGEVMDQGFGIAVDSRGCAVVCGMALSRKFPTFKGFQMSPGSEKMHMDGFVSKIKPDGSELLFSTFLGGSGSDNCLALHLDGEGFIAVAGTTASQDFPVKKAFQDQLQGNECGYVAKLTPDGSELVCSTMLGGSGGDMARALLLADDGTFYVAGRTTSTDFPLKHPFQDKYRGPDGTFGDAFLARLGRNADSLLWSTYFGGTGRDFPLAVARLPDGRLVVGGSTSSPDFCNPQPAEGKSPNVRTGRGFVLIVEEK